MMDIDKVIEVLKKGGLAVVPTDTIYGIIGDATNEEVIKKVYEVKNRDYSKALIIMVSSIEMLKDYVVSISDIEKKLIEKYWPGRLTILFEKSDKVSNYATNNSSLVGIRWGDNKDINKIIEGLGKPIISTSANISNMDPITKIELLDKSIIERMDYIYDGGEVVNLSSTIVKVSDGMIDILRRGDLAEQIEKDFK